MPLWRQGVRFIQNHAAALQYLFLHGRHIHGSNFAAIPQASPSAIKTGSMRIVWYPTWLALQATGTRKPSTRFGTRMRYGSRC